MQIPKREEKRRKRKRKRKKENFNLKGLTGNVPQLRAV